MNTLEEWNHKTIGSRSHIYKREQKYRSTAVSYTHLHIFPHHNISICQLTHKHTLAVVHTVYIQHEQTKPIVDAGKKRVQIRKRRMKEDQRRARRCTCQVKRHTV